LPARAEPLIINFERALTPEQSDLSRELLKDLYNFAFLALTDAVQERDLERALVERIRDFLVELGVEFAFVGSQYRLEVDGDEYFIDLLFYHLKLRRYVVIDLKVTEFKPEYAGKMNSMSAPLTTGFATSGTKPQSALSCASPRSEPLLNLPWI
jgi:predicted nuclease of restriction endonuclease-like (RecB) superfamily